MITGSINLDKIDKTKLIKGEKGLYLNFVLFDSPNNQYGDDFMVVQSLTKEQREAGEKGEILGNAKNFKSEHQTATEDTKLPWE